MAQFCFLEGQSIYLLFSSDIVNLLLKTDGGRDRKPNFVIFEVWSALILGVWMSGVEVEQKVLFRAC